MRLLVELMLASMLVGLLVAFVVLFLGRFEVLSTSLRDWVIIRAPKLLSEAFSCDFCLCWWLSVAVCVVAAPFVGWWMLFVPVFSTPVARIYVA